MIYYNNPNLQEEYMGFSTEAKPISNVTVGTKFKEFDTGNVYIYTGVSPDYWIQNPFNEAGSGTGSGIVWASSSW